MCCPNSVFAIDFTSLPWSDTLDAQKTFFLRVCPRSGTENATNFLAALVAYHKFAAIAHLSPIEDVELLTAQQALRKEIWVQRSRRVRSKERQR